MIAFAILAIATLALVSVRTYLLQAQVKTQKLQQATLLASSVMMEIEAAVDLDFDRDLENDFTIDTSDWPESYDYAVTQTREGSELQRVDMSIRWKDQQGPQDYKIWTKFTRD